MEEGLLEHRTAQLLGTQSEGTSSHSPSHSTTLLQQVWLKGVMEFLFSRRMKTTLHNM